MVYKRDNGGSAVKIGDAMRIKKPLAKTRIVSQKPRTRTPDSFLKTRKASRPGM
jgi:hypothetical protein